MFRIWGMKFPRKEIKEQPWMGSRDDDGKTEQKVQKSSKNKGDNICPSSSPVVPYTKQEIMEFLDKNDNILSKAELNNAFEVTRSRFPAYRTWQASRPDPDSGDPNGDGRIGREEMEELLNFVTRLNHQVKP